MTDYERALYYVLWGKWDDLFTLMLRSEDDLLKKKIERFLNAYYYALSQEEVVRKHDQLIAYLDFATGEQTIYTFTIED
ncbi:MAG TPA: YhdB family protein [Pseudogracilibacillus sp.]|nr:YhdB family protein [Pseudogracilibacillus sp.]